MPSRRSLVTFLASLISLAAAPGCTERLDTSGRDAGGGAEDAGAPADAAREDAGPLADTGPRLDDVLIYAHSSDTLFTFSPYTNRVSTIGPFTLPGGGGAPDMLDLAVNAEGDVYTCSADTLYRVDPETALATPVADFDLPAGERLFALTFLVPGMLEPTGEAMIGATNEGVLYRVDPASARTTRIGTYPDGWASSGDLVSIEGLGTFATLKRDDFGSDVVARIEFDSSGRAAVLVLGACGYTNLFGLGYWGRNLYGFTSRGELLSIDRATGAGTIATEMTGTGQFWGAGVTTQAPVLF